MKYFFPSLEIYTWSLPLKGVWCFTVYFFLLLEHVLLGLTAHSMVVRGGLCGPCHGRGKSARGIQAKKLLELGEFDG